MIIYIRHGDDSDSHLMDKPLTSKGKDQAAKVAAELLSRYGPPSIVYYCPLKRTKQSMKAMMAQVRDFGHSQHIHAHKEPKLSRFFTPSELSDRRIREEFKLYDIPMYEDRDALKKRASRYADKVRSRNHGKVVWCITHALIMKKAAKHLEVGIPKHLEYCHWFKF